MKLPFLSTLGFRFRRPVVYAGAYLFLCLALKAHQIFVLASTHRWPASAWAGLPWSFAQDIGVAFFVWLACDLALPALRRLPGPARVWLAWPLQGAYALAVLYQALMFKFYLLFGTFPTYGLWQHADRPAVYRRGIAAEMDFATVCLAAAALVYYAGVRALDRSRPTERSGRLRPWAAAALIVLWLAGSAAGRALRPRMNYYGLDRNPLAELVLSFAAAAGGPVEAIAAGNTRDSGFTFDAGASPRRAVVPAAALKPLPLEARRNLNVVMIVMESTTPAYTGLARPEFRSLTPNLCRLAERSLVFSNHYCQEPASLKSLYTLFTGRYAYQTRNWKRFLIRAKNDRTLPEILRAHGYDTAFFTSADGRVYFQNDYLRGRFRQVVDLTVLKRRRAAYECYGACYDDRVLVDLFDRYLQSAPGKFFVCLSPYAPHHPYTEFPAEFQDLRIRDPFGRYQRSLAFADDLLGRLVACLERRGLAESTLLVVVSDHGEAFRQHPGNFLHSIHLYEENVKTVFLLSQPRLLVPGVYAHLSRHLDVTPTVLGALGYDEGLGADGVNLLASHPEGRAGFATTFSDRRLGLRDGAWKYILDRTYDTEELYDLETDAHETTNLAASRPDLCRAYRALLLKLEGHLKR